MYILELTGDTKKQFRFFVQWCNAVEECDARMFNSSTSVWCI